MIGSTHLAGGLLAGAVVSVATGAHISTEMVSLAGLGLAGVGALAPDWFQINVPGANSIARGIVGHRGLSHWLLTVAVVWGSSRLLLGGTATFLAAGWLSHLALDSLAGGAATFWPWPGRIVLANVKTGSSLDKIVGAACLVLAIAIILGRLL
jgi:membrane-bound metal-dependent hydrolase YbcI (DUF457 family)